MWIIASRILRWGVFALLGLLLLAPAVQADSGPPLEQLELGGVPNPITPELRIDPMVAPANRPILSAGLALPGQEVTPGATISLTVSLTNSGTAVARSYQLYLWLDKELSLVAGSPLAPAGTLPAYTWTSAPLAPGSSQSWQLSVQVGSAAAADQRIGLYGHNASVTDNVRATAIVDVAGAPAAPESGGSSGGTDEGWMPRFLAPATSLFSGAATFAYDFEVAPGRRGLQPGLGLAYNSRSTDGTMGWVHSSEVGEGWSLAGIPSITRREVAYCWPSNPQWICVENLFSLTLNGQSHNLIPTDETQDPQGGQIYGLYQAEGNPALYVERRNDVAGNGSSANVTGEYWLVRTPDGSAYRFGHNADAEQILFRTDGTSQVSDPAAYTGRLNNISTFRWWLDQVVDVSGNGMAITYLDGDDPQYGYLLEAIGGDGCGNGHCREVATYPKTISYNNATAGVMANWQSSVHFDYDTLDYAPVGGGRPIFATMLRLKSLTMKQAGQTLWDYRLNYIEISGPHANTVVIFSLGSIQKRDFNGNASLLPAVHFEYEEKTTGSRFECWEPPIGCDDITYQYPYLVEVHNGYGGVYTFAYVDISHNGVRSYYVTDLNTWDGFRQAYPTGQATTHTNYNYDLDLACFDHWDATPSCSAGGSASNKLVGFGSVAIRVYAGGNPAVLNHTVTDFLVGYSLVNGKSSWVGEYYAPSGVDLLSETSQGWTGDDSFCPQNGLVFDFICLREQRQKTYYYPAGGGLETLETWQEYQYLPGSQGNRQWGQVTTQKAFYKDRAGVTQLERREITLYRTNESTWVIAPWATGVYDAGGTPKALTLNLYDGQMDPDDQAITQGKLTLSRSLLLVDIDPGGYFLYQSLDATFGYDSYGNQSAASTYAGYGQVGHDGANWNTWTAAGNGSAARTATTQYENYGLRVNWTQNPAGHTTDVTAYHGRFAWLPVSVADANNLTTQYVYDSLARLVKVVRPGDTAANPSLQYIYTLNTATNPLRIDSVVQPNGGASVRQQMTRYYDGLGQLVQQSDVARNIDGYGLGDVVTLTSYDPLGRPTCQSIPFSAPSGGGYQSNTTCEQQVHTTTIYDYRGGIRQVIAPDGTASIRTYQIPGQWAVTVGRGMQQEWWQNANGNITLNTFDAFGQLEWVGQKDDGGWCSALQVTTYDYNTVGNLENVTRGGYVCGSAYTAGNVVTTMTYDSLGRKLTMDDPDMGAWSYSYDPAGNLVRQEDANANTHCFYYDVLNQLTNKAVGTGGSCPVSPPTSGTNHLATYVYGAAAPNKGRLLEVKWGNIPTNNRDSFSYDSLGQLSSQTRWIDGRSYTMTTSSFDALHRPLTVQYPIGATGEPETVILTYDREGENTLTAGVNSLVTNVAYNVRGQITQLNRANSAHTTYSYYGVTDVAGGGSGDSNFRLQRIQHSSLGDALPDFTYQYDLTGNVTRLESQAQGSPTDVQTFTYDHLSRLKTAQATGGVANYSQTFTYDLLGNIQSDGFFSYSYNDPNHRHAVTSLMAGPMPAATFGYDANGNMVSRTDNGASFTQNFDGENRLVYVATPGSNTSTSFAYDAAGQRTKATVTIPGSSMQVTYYPFPNYEEELRYTYQPGCFGPEPCGGTWVLTGTVRRSRYTLAGQAIAVRVTSTPPGPDDGLFYVHSDHLGSTSFLSLPNGSKKAGSEARYLPFGDYRGTPPATNPSITDRGYTGHRHNDSLGLVYANARFYVPGVGRFLSADTIVPEPKNPQSYNRYSYVQNDPLNYTDPTGHCRYDDEGNFVFAVDCTVNEFAKLSWEHRMLWLGMFMDQTKVWWFWNLMGILQFFKEDADFSDLSGWASFSDGGVLQAIQDGWRISEGLNPIGHYVSGEQGYGWATGGNKWATFFDLEKQFREGLVSKDAVLEQWGMAEQAGVQHGLLVAAPYYETADSHTQAKIDYFVLWGDAYRAMVASGVNEVEIRGTRITAQATDPTLPSSAGFVYWWAKNVIALPVDSFEPGPIPVLTDFYNAYP